MAGLDLGLSICFEKCFSRTVMDARVKPAHDMGCYETP